VRDPRHSTASRRIVEIDRECGILEKEYESLERAEREGKHRVALGHAAKIRERCKDFRDVEERSARLEIEADYADGLAFEAQGDFPRAVKSYERCLSREPAHRDAKQRAENCRSKIAPRPGRRTGQGDRSDAEPAEPKRSEPLPTPASGAPVSPVLPAPPAGGGTSSANPGSPGSGGGAAVHPAEEAAPAPAPARSAPRAR
jgi:hypothetical protein